jgi:hypothetical protein
MEHRERTQGACNGRRGGSALVPGPCEGLACQRAPLGTDGARAVGSRFEILMNHVSAAFGRRFRLDDFSASAGHVKTIRCGFPD